MRKLNPVDQVPKNTWKKEGYKSRESFLKKALKRNTIYSAFKFVKKSIGKEWAKLATEKGKDLFNMVNSRPEMMSVHEAIRAISDLSEQVMGPLVDQIAKEKGLNLSAQFRKAIIDATSEEANHFMDYWRHKGGFRKSSKGSGKKKRKSSRRRRR